MFGKGGSASSTQHCNKHEVNMLHYEVLYTKTSKMLTFVLSASGLQQAGNTIKQ